MRARFDIHCRTCGGDSEIVSDLAAIACGCGSLDVERKWTAPPMFAIKNDVRGTTPVVRKRMMDLTKKFKEKERREAGVSHENTKTYY